MFNHQQIKHFPSFNDIQILVEQYANKQNANEIPLVVKELRAFYSLHSKPDQKSQFLTFTQLAEVCRILISHDIQDLQLNNDLIELENKIAEPEVFKCFRLLHVEGFYNYDAWFKLREQTENLSKEKLQNICHDVSQEILAKKLVKFIQNNNMEKAEELLSDGSLEKNTIMKIFNEFLQGNEKNLLELISFLSHAHFDFNCHYENGETPLIRMIRHGKSNEAMSALIKANAHVDFADKYNNAPIHYAACLSKPHAVQILLDNSADLENIYATLICCIDNEYPQRNGRLNVQKYSLFKLFTTQTIKNDLDIIQMLLEKTSRSLDSFQDVLRHALQCRNREAFKLLLQLGIPPYKGMLEDIIKTNEVEFAASFIKHPVPDNFSKRKIPAGLTWKMYLFCFEMGFVPDGFSCAHIFEIPEAVQYVLEHDMETAKSQFNDPYLSTHSYHLESLMLLIKAGMVNKQYSSQELLRIAIYTKNKTVAMALLNSGVTPHKSILLDIIKKNDIEFASELVEKIVSAYNITATIPSDLSFEMYDFSFKNGLIPDGFSCAHIFQLPEAVYYVLKNNPEIAKSQFDDPLLDKYIYHPQVVLWLIQAGIVDVRTTNANGVTALHLAAKKGNLAVVKMLIASGADITAYDNNGKTPYEYAQMNRRSAANQNCMHLINTAVCARHNYEKRKMGK